MKNTFALVLISIFLIGCQTSTVLNNDIDNISSANANDAYYLQISKDLYISRQYKQAFQIANKLAEKNNSEAQYLLGYLHYYGQGVPVDFEQGKKWIEASANSGYRPAIEALVMIEHGLTPDNKCPSVTQIPTAIATSPKVAEINETSQMPVTVAGMTLNEGEVLITPSGQLTKTAEVAQETKSISTATTIATNAATKAATSKPQTKPESIWERYTIEIIKNSSKLSAKDFITAFKTQHPELSDYIISYKSKVKPFTYGVGFSTYQSQDAAKETLQDLKIKLNNTSLIIKPLHQYVPLKI